MPLTFIIFPICLIIGVVYLVYVKRKERQLIEQVTPITRGEWSERRVVLNLLKGGINPKAIFHDLYIQKPNGEYTQVDVAIRQCLPQNPGIPIYSVIVFFGNSEFKNVTCNANNTFIIYPRSIRQVVAEILMQPNANYGNKYEIMDVFAKAVQNGNDPMIVSSQINSAAYYGRNTPQSTYTISLNSLFRFGRFSHRRVFW